MIFSISDGIYTASISTNGSQINSLKKCGKEYIWNANPTYWANSAPIMFPVCGLLKDNEYTYKDVKYSLSKHGFTRGNEFEKVSLSDKKLVLKLIKTENISINYPFDFEFFTSFEISEGVLKCTYTVKNISDKDDMFFNTGSHEAYSLFSSCNIDDYYIEFEKNEDIIRHFADNGLFSGETETIGKGVLQLTDSLFDRDAIFLKDISSRCVTLKCKHSDLAIKISFDTPHLGIWKKQGAGFICIEPWNGLGDRENHNGDITKKESILTLSPMSEYVSNHTIEIISKEDI